jgi:ferric-dicitrate binding protein FerR (iron transport regulator)
MYQERIYILIARKMAGEATEEELKELARLLDQEPAVRYSSGIILELDNLDDPAGLGPDEERDILLRAQQNRDGYLESETRMHIRRRKSRLAVSMAVAAALVALVVVGSLVFSRRRAARTVAFGNEITTKVASKSTILLPDGSKVSLNSCSRLNYADAFSQGNRTVTLYGEGFFEIRHDPDHPFVIHAGNIDIKVLGTVVNVKAYPEDYTLETTLIRGKVEVDFNNAGNQKIILKPDQKITIYKDRPQAAASRPDSSAGVSGFAVSTVKKYPDRSIPDIAWTQDNLAFSSETLEELSHDLERRYNVKFHFQDGRYKQEVFSGAFGKQDIHEVMHALQLTSDFHYRIDSSQNVYIW